METNDLIKDEVKPSKETKKSPKDSRLKPGSTTVKVARTEMTSVSESPSVTVEVRKPAKFFIVTDHGKEILITNKDVAKSYKRKIGSQGSHVTEVKGL